MDTGEFLKYVNAVIVGSNRGSMEQALKELRIILGRNGADQKKLNLLNDLSCFTLQIVNVQEKKPGEELTMEDLNEVIRQGNEWVEEMRRIR